MKTLKSIGLKTATEGEIRELIDYYESKGYIVEHKKSLSSGKTLPFNGVLYIKELH